VGGVPPFAKSDRRMGDGITPSVPFPWVDPWVETPVFMPFLTR
jgi:hypothetical protein